MFSLSDLFAFGAGCDVAGAWLLARGLLPSPRQIARRATYGGLYPGALIDDVDSRVTARVGAWSLFAGFSIQVAAYAVLLGVGLSSDASPARSVVASIAAATPVAAIIFGERRTHRDRANKLLVRVSREDVVAGATGSNPGFEMLARIAEWRRDARHASEADEDYARRVFGLAKR
jgi:hypothetical protein